MFGSFSSLGLANLPAKGKIDPKDIPPPTPISLPRYQPFAQQDAPVDPVSSLTELLKHCGRVNNVLGTPSISAIGLNLNVDAPVEDLIPDASFAPDFKQWDQLTADSAREQNQSTRKPLRNGGQSPGCQVYLERKKELTNSNEDGFRTVRRIPPPKGKQQARLGNAYEFFRCLELLTAFWDDPTQPTDLPLSPEMSPVGSPSSPNDARTESPPSAESKESDNYGRTGAGSSMPAEFRQNLINAFIKLVAYDFGCNVSMARLEPRLQMSSPDGARHPRKTYCPSGCSFIFQSPTSREAARAGQVCGPLAAVSCRPSVTFTAPDIESAQSMDLAREIVAALIAAQHRAREGKKEVRFGEGQWWTSKPRWGGGSGGPIGREIDKYVVHGDKDARPEDSDGLARPVTKKPRKNMSIYDSYRMVRPPSYTWDKKALYEAIGKQNGSDHDDIFVVSSLFHHVSFLRVRVPIRLLEVLAGSPEEDPTKRSWGSVQAWRSPWYDLFDTNQRIEAMRVLWAMLAYQMRVEETDSAMRNA